MATDAAVPNGIKNTAEETVTPKNEVGQCLKIVDYHGCVPEFCVLQFGHEGPCQPTEPAAEGRGHEPDCMNRGIPNDGSCPSCEPDSVTVAPHKLGCEFPARSCICEYLLTKQLQPIEPSSPSAVQEPWYVTAYQFIRSAGWDEEWCASGEGNYWLWLCKKLESLAALAPTQPSAEELARRIAEYTQTDILTPHGMYDELRCFFCGADEEQDHKDDCIWKLAQKVSRD